MQAQIPLVGYLLGISGRRKSCGGYAQILTDLILLRCRRRTYIYMPLRSCQRFRFSVYEIVFAELVSSRRALMVLRCDKWKSLIKGPSGAAWRIEENASVQSAS